MSPPLKINDFGAEVASLQRYLNIALHGNLVEDGHFGPTTQAAVMQFQREAGLVVDGVAGDKTLAAMRGCETGHLLQESDLQAAADKLGVPLASIKAINAVETSGHGFLPDGRPVILFERHVMYQRLADAMPEGVEVLARAYPAIINKARGGYAGGASEWQRLQNAALVSGRDNIAVESASWGAFQIMGYHWQALGYESAQAFAEAMRASEGQQLDAFVRFIEADPVLLKALKSRKWAEFAKRYNGPAYRQNLYDVKLARAFERFSVEEGEEA